MHTGVLDKCPTARTAWSGYKAGKAHRALLLTPLGLSGFENTPLRLPEDQPCVSASDWKSLLVSFGGTSNVWNVHSLADWPGQLSFKRTCPSHLLPCFIPASCPSCWWGALGLTGKCRTKTTAGLAANSCSPCVLEVGGREVIALFLSASSWGLEVSLQLRDPESFRDRDKRHSCDFPFISVAQNVLSYSEVIWACNVKIRISFKKNV